MAILTILESKYTLTKKFWKDGRKESPTFSSGAFKVVDVGHHEDLAKLIKELTNKQALCYSTPLGYDEGNIVVKGNEDEESAVISRTKEYFDYPCAAGWLFIDMDEDLSESEVIEKLADLYPPFGTTSYVYATSSSNGIGDKKGFHLYYQVEDVSTSFNCHPASN